MSEWILVKESKVTAAHEYLEAWREPVSRAEGLFCAGFSFFVLADGDGTRPQ